MITPAGAAWVPLLKNRLYCSCVPPTPWWIATPEKPLLAKMSFIDSTLAFDVWLPLPRSEGFPYTPRLVGTGVSVFVPGIVGLFRSSPTRLL